MQVGVVHVLRAVHHHVAHGRADDRLLGVSSRAQRRDNIFRGPVAKAIAAVAAQVGGDPAVDSLPAGQIGTRGIIQGFFLQCECARRMTAAAVAGALDQVGAARNRRIRIPRRVEGRRIRGRREQLAPDCHRPADRQRPGNAIGVLRADLGLHAVHEIGVQSGDVRIAHACIGGVGHGGIQSHAFIVDAMPDGAIEVIEREFADPRFLIGCDVGAVDRAHRRVDCQSARK